MAKRKTLKRQRDKARQELALLEKQMYHTRIRTDEYLQRVRTFECQLNVYEIEFKHGGYDATTIVRKMLHDIVDGGYLDNCVEKSSEIDNCRRIVRNKILIKVLQPEANYKNEVFAQLWGEGE